MDGVTLDQWIRIAMTVATIVSAGLNVYLFYKTRNTTEQREHRRAMEKLESDRREGDAVLHKRIDRISGEHQIVGARLSGRVSVLETTIKHLPTQQDVTAIREDISELSSTVSGIGERSASNNQMLHTIQDYLMGKRR